MSAMDPARYEIVPIGIGHDGRWYLRRQRDRDAARRPRRRSGALGRGGDRRSACCRIPTAARWSTTPATAARRRARRSAASLPGRSTWSFRCCTAPSARTARCRDCSNWRACRMSARACSAPRSGWTRTRRSGVARRRRAGRALSRDRCAPTTMSDPALRDESRASSAIRCSSNRTRSARRSASARSSSAPTSRRRSTTRFSTIARC